LRDAQPLPARTDDFANFLDRIFHRLSLYYRTGMIILFLSKVKLKLPIGHTLAFHLQKEQEVPVRESLVLQLSVNRL
jgi:hypothetical protein